MLASFPGLAGQVQRIHVGQGTTGTRAEIHLDGRNEFNAILLKNPDRLAVDLPQSSLPAKLQLPAGAGVVTGVRTGQPEPGRLRVVFDLAQSGGSVSTRMESAGNGQVLVIEWAAGSAPASAALVPAPAAAQAAVPVATVAAATSVQQQQVSPEDILNGRVNVEVNPAVLVKPADMASAPPAVASDAPAAAVVPPPQAAPTPAPPRPVAAPRGEMRPLVVAIDPGHGGQDPGAIGPSGRYEKHAVLEISRELARQINATPGMQAYLIRDTDVYVERPQRARKARAAKADMFVSIHADAAQNRSATGSSVYVLSLKGASSQHARWLADRENASGLVGGVRLTKDTLSNVLLDLAQSGHMKASQDAADHVLDGLKGLGKTHKPQIEYANFEVLRNSDMPAMLVETGFISNPEEEKRLFDPAHQRKVAAAVLTGIRNYFTRQPPPGTLFALKAEADALAGSGGSP